MSKFNLFHVKLTEKQEVELKCFQKDHQIIQLTIAQVQEILNQAPGEDKCILPLTANQLNQLKTAAGYKQPLKLEFHKVQIKEIARLNYDVDIDLPVISCDQKRGLLKRTKK